MSTTEGHEGGTGFTAAELVTRLARVQQAVGAAAHGAAGGARARLVKLTTVASLSTATAADRGSCVIVVPSQDEVDELAELGEPWPGLLVVTRGTTLPATMASAGVVTVDSTRLALATLSQAFDLRPTEPRVVDPDARIAADAALGDGVSVGPGVVVAAGASVGAGTVLRAGSYVGAGSVIGADCVLHPHVVIYDGIELGARVQVHAGTVIGADGFGYAASPHGAAKIHHLGSVRIADDVEIGANSAIDRGTLDDTSIGARTKIDNHCQVGHNVVIGSDCLIAGMTGIAGSVRIGDGVIIGGAVGIADHVVIGSGARIAGRSGVTKDIPPGETWAGFPARPYRQYTRSLYLAERLETIWHHLRGSIRTADSNNDRDDTAAEAQNSSRDPDEPGPAER